MAQKYRDWIEKEVVYIISDREKEAFLDLEFEEEREGFITAFWRRRDPDSLTPVNEFKEEHYRRIELANRQLGREAAVPGWMTDRGKMYIILGEPRDRETFMSVPFLYPSELWFYGADKQKGLPPLYLLFFQEYHAGPYRLFNHLLDGPEDLMPAQPLDRTNSRMEAYEMLQTINPALAHATITMRADQGAMAGIVEPMHSALDTQTLLADIYLSPFRRVDIRYVNDAEGARGLVESEYLFNYVPNAGMANVLPGPGGTSFVHYSIEIEPQHMTLAKSENRYYTSFELRGEVVTVDESKVVHSFVKEPYVQLTESQFREVGSRPFAYRDMFPLIEGEFRLRVVLKNKARSEYTVFEADLEVPARSAGEAFLGAPLLLYGMSRLRGSGEEGPELYRTYRIGNTSFDPNAKRVVSIGNYLMAHIPLENVGPEHDLVFRIVSREDGAAEALVDRVESLATYERPVVTRIPLADAVGGRYRFLVELRGPNGNLVGSESAEFDISPRRGIQRPWALRESIDGERLGVVQVALAEQSLRLDRDETARQLAEDALRADLNLVRARLLLARFHLDEGSYRDTIRLLEPARARAPRNVEVLLALGDAHFQIQNYKRASGLFEAAMELRAPDTALLNALGICHSQLRNTEQAIAYLKRSLELDPRQERTQSLLERLSSPRR